MNNLVRLLNLPPNIVAVTRTSDGFYLGRAAGDCGFNAFFGKPSHHAGPGRDASITTWRRYTFTERKSAIRAARGAGIPLRAFLPK
jgi:hypothetical protein